MLLCLSLLPTTLILLDSPSERVNTSLQMYGAGMRSSVGDAASSPGRLCVPAGRPAGPDTRARPWQLECSLPFAAARHSDLTRQPLRAHQYLSADVWCRSAPICGRCSNCSSGEPFLAHKTRSFSCTSTCRARAFYMNMGAGRPARRARA